MACDTFYPDVNGAARFAERLVAGLVERGHDVHVIAPSKKHRQHGTFRELIEGQTVTVHRWASWRWYPHDWLRFVLPWRVRPQARTLLDALQPDVVHIQSHIMIGRGVAVEAEKRDIPIIATNHVMPENVLDFTMLPRYLDEVLIKLAWNDAKRTFDKTRAVTTPTRRAADFLEAAISIENVLPVSCGINAGNYQPDLSPRTEHRILFVGRLTKEKQLDLLFRAVKRLVPTLDVHLEIVGGGDQRRHLEEHAKKLGIADRVVFHGRVDEDRLRQIYSGASVFAMPSIAELQSIATMEAMASGLPVVAANAMALPHLVHDGENGYLFDPRSEHDLAEKLSVVLSADPAERLRMQQASLDGVKIHDINTTLDTFERLYRGELVA